MRCLQYLKQRRVGRGRHKRRKICKKKSRVRSTSLKQNIQQRCIWAVFCTQSTDAGNISTANYFQFSSTQPHTHSHKQTHSWGEQACRGKRCFNINQVLRDTSKTGRFHDFISQHSKTLKNVNTVYIKALMTENNQRCSMEKKTCPPPPKVQLTTNETNILRDTKCTNSRMLKSRCALTLTHITYKMPTYYHVAAVTPGHTLQPSLYSILSIKTLISK